MYRILGFYTQNTLKTLYVLEELGVDFEFVFIDLTKAEHRTDEFRQKALFGKVPVLEHDGHTLFESGAICRYAANVCDSPLYPDDKAQRAQVDQWMDFFSCHLGRWLTTLFFEAVMRPRAGLGEPDEESIAEATKFAQQQCKQLNGYMKNRTWLANDAFSIADLFAFAYVEQYRAVNFSLQDYENIKAWFDRVAALDSIAAARARLPQ